MKRLRRACRTCAVIAVGWGPWCQQTVAAEPGGSLPSPFSPDDGSDIQTCELECTEAADAALAECIAAGESPKACAEQAEARREACLAECEGPQVPPANPPTTCEEHCTQAADQIRKSCAGSGRDQAACEAHAAEMEQACLEDCTEPDPPGDPEPPSCADECEVAAEVMRSECPDPDTDDCQLQLDEFLANCLSECDPPDPSDPPTPPGPTDPPSLSRCQERCALTEVSMMAACVVTGRNPKKCEARLAEFLDDCNQQCEEISNSPCENLCIDMFHGDLGACVEGGGERPECGQMASDGLALCLRECRPDDRELPCEAGCADAATAALLECERTGETPEVCAVVFQDTLRPCLGDCREPAMEPSCEERCAASDEEFRERCEEAGGGDECTLQADEMLEACLRPCRKPEPPVLPCDVQCENVARAAGAGCLAQGDPEEDCAEREAMVLDECLTHCGDPATEPPSCQSRCRQAVEAVLAQCLADGRDAVTCEARADEIEATCMEHCDKGLIRPLSSDLDTDGDVDLADVMAFHECLSGSDPGRTADCFEADVDNDGDVDLSDFIQFQSELGRSE